MMFYLNPHGLEKSRKERGWKQRLRRGHRFQQGEKGGSGFPRLPSRMAPSQAELVSVRTNGKVEFPAAEPGRLRKGWAVKPPSGTEFQMWYI